MNLDRAYKVMFDVGIHEYIMMRMQVTGGLSTVTNVQCISSLTTLRQPRNSSQTPAVQQLFLAAVALACSAGAGLAALAVGIAAVLVGEGDVNKSHCTEVVVESLRLGGTPVLSPCDGIYTSCSRPRNNG